jgi:hypothetical protein
LLLAPVVLPARLLLVRLLPAWLLLARLLGMLVCISAS